MSQLSCAEQYGDGLSNFRTSSAHHIESEFVQREFFEDFVGSVKELSEMILEYIEFCKMTKISKEDFVKDIKSFVADMEINKFNNKPHSLSLAFESIKEEPTLGIPKNVTSEIMILNDHKQKDERNLKNDFNNEILTTIINSEPISFEKFNEKSMNNKKFEDTKKSIINDINNHIPNITNIEPTYYSSEKIKKIIYGDLLKIFRNSIDGLVVQINDGFGTEEIYLDNSNIKYKELNQNSKLFFSEDNKIKKMYNEFINQLIGKNGLTLKLRLIGNSDLYIIDEIRYRANDGQLGNIDIELFKNNENYLNEVSN